MSYASKFEKIISMLHLLPNYREVFKAPGFGKRVITANAEEIKKLYDEKEFTRSALARRMTHHAGARFSMVSQDDERASIKRGFLKPSLNHHAVQRVTETACTSLIKELDTLIDQPEVEVYASLQRSISNSFISNVLGVTFADDNQKVFDSMTEERIKAMAEDSLPRMLILNAIPFMPMFVKNWFAPHTKKRNDAIEKLVTFLYDYGIDEDNSLAQTLKQAESKGVLDHKEVLGEYRALLIGANTLALSVMWTLYLLSKYPEKKILVERDEDYARMAYMESLRLLPPFFMFNYEKKKSKCPVHFWKSGEQVNISVSTVHRIDEYWNRPHFFEPERFAGGLSSLVKGSYIPFGGGERSCPGAGISMVVGPALVHAISNKYTFSLTREPVIKRRIELTTADGKMFFKFQTNKAN